MKLVSAVLLSVLLPSAVYAEGDLVSRRDGFLAIWRSIERPAAETNEEPYTDVREGSGGFTEITYAKNRGILEDEARFHPDGPLLLGDALLWLYRTRNVADPGDMEEENLPALIARYPIVSQEQDLETALSSEGLFSVMQTLDVMLREEVHEVSLYGEDFHGQGTAFGESFDMNALTAAHRTFPWNTLVKVTNIGNGKSVTVRINDRGPYVDGRDMDLSLAAFTEIEERSRGVLRARFERLGDASLVGPCTGEPRLQKRISRDVRFHRGVPHEFALGETLTLAANRFFIVDGVTYPDGFFSHVRDWVGPEEIFTFKPSVEGEYRFLLGTTEGRRREMTMRVVECSQHRK